jgi:hypothetical protein
MRADWEANREELVGFWKSGKTTAVALADSLPWLYLRGSSDTLPWAAVTLGRDDRPPVAGTI